VTKDQLARISSDKPQKRVATTAAAESPEATTGEVPSPVQEAKPKASVAAATPAVTAQQARRGAVMDGRDPSFAFVDMNKVFKEFSKTKEAEGKINASKDEAKKKFDERADAYKKRLDEINALNRKLASAKGGRASAELASERDQKITAIKNLEREINDFRTTREKELREQALKMRGEIVQQITGRIKSLSGSGVNLVLDRSGNSLNGVPLVLISPSTEDMSGRVSSDLDGGASSPFSGTRDLKLAVIDFNRAFKYYNKTKDAEKKVNDAKEAAKKEFDERAAAYKEKLDEVNKLNQQLNSPELTTAKKLSLAKQRDEKITDIKELEKQINDFRQSRENQLRDHAMHLRDGIVSEMTNKLQTRVANESRALVFDSSGQSLNGVPIVLWTSGVPDLSAEIIDALNRSAREGNTELVASNQLRFGICDMDRAFKALPETKQSQQEMNSEREKAKSELSGADENTRKRKEKELQDLAQKKRDPIVQKLKDAVALAAEKDGFNLVFDSSGQSVNGVPVLVDTRDLPDLTDEVIAGATGH
jgi:Skp family chaperone for outer membrane proteins